MVLSHRDADHISLLCASSPLWDLSTRGRRRSTPHRKVQSALSFTLGSCFSNTIHSYKNCPRSVVLIESVIILVNCKLILGTGSVGLSIFRLLSRGTSPPLGHPCAAACRGTLCSCLRCCLFCRHPLLLWIFLWIVYFAIIKLLIFDDPPPPALPPPCRSSASSIVHTCLTALAL